MAGLLAFGAFFLARGGDGPAERAPTAQPQSAPVEDTPAPMPETQRIFALQDINLDQGAITLALFGPDTAAAPRVIRDDAALRAARDTVYFSDAAGDGERALSTAQFFRDDVLLATVMCADAPCRSLGAPDDAAVFGLLATATPSERVQDSFDNYDDYIATIQAIADDPDFMLLDARPDADFPLPEQVQTVLVDLPTLVLSPDAAFDTAIYRALLAETIRPILPENTTVTDTIITALDPVLLGDRDNNRPILAQGAPVPFDGAQMHALQVLISGVADLDDATLTALDDATRQRFDFTADFDRYVATRVQTDCADCLIPLPDARFVEDAQINQSTPARYDLVYYDLREAP